MDNKNIDYLVLLILNFLSFVLGRVFAFWFGCKYCDCCKPFRHAYMEIELLWSFCKAILIVQEKKKNSLYKYLHWEVTRWKLTTHIFILISGGSLQVSENKEWGIPLQHSCFMIFYDGLRSHAILKSIA